MTLNVYAVYDKKVGYLTPTYDTNDATASRNFAYAMSKTDSVFGFQPSDFSLYQVGTFSTDSGLLIAVTPPKFIMEGADAANGRVSNEV